MKRVRVAVFAVACGVVALRAQTVMLAPEIVSASRLAEPPEQVAATLRIFSADEIRTAPTATLDGALRALPAFTLFRRSDSLIANPTAQGVSLRGLGPSGASRSLVLLDGVPLNDPFGGWVAWTKIPRNGLARTELIPGGGATAWGNAALGGIVQLLSPPLQEKPGNFTATFGDFSTRSAEASFTQPVGRGAAQLSARDFVTDGFSLVAPERRGAIDIAAWSRHRWWAARATAPLGENLAFTATARGYEEFRGNGTPYTKNGSREKFLSASLIGSPTKNFSWNAIGYAQGQSFASTFSSVNATRTAETPASDQFKVPSTAFGAAWTGAWQHDDSARTSAGFDARAVRGETRENFTFTAGNFTRQRVAGGEQTFLGLFALREQPLATNLRATFGARLDDWRETDGHRRETDRATGAVLRDDRYADRDGVEFSPSAGLVWMPEKSWRLRANAQQAFRVPTLNELYRPFRQGTTVVETNPDLRTERVTSGELGAEWSQRRELTEAEQRPFLRAGWPRPAGIGLTLGATAFWNELRDAVGNITLARGPGTFPLFGTLAAGGIGRQRLNVDRVRVRGLELSAAWQPTPLVGFNAALLANDARVQRATVAPALVGKRVAEVPRTSASLGASVRLPSGISVTPRVRWIGRQFEDDENTLRLGEVAVVDVGVTHPLGHAMELFLSVENLGNARVETGRSADGVVNVGTPRLALGGIRGNW